MGSKYIQGWSPNTNVWETIKVVGDLDKKAVALSLSVKGSVLKITVFNQYTAREKAVKFYINGTLVTDAEAESAIQTQSSAEHVYELWHFDKWDAAHGGTAEWKRVGNYFWLDAAKTEANGHQYRRHYNRVLLDGKFVWGAHAGKNYAEDELNNAVGLELDKIADEKDRRENGLLRAGDLVRHRYALGMRVDQRTEEVMQNMSEYALKLHEALTDIAALAPSRTEGDIADRLKEAANLAQQIAGLLNTKHLD